MKVWLLKDGEHLPIQTDVTKMRTWMLAEALAARGHEVTWWSSTHSHQLKKCLHSIDVEEKISPNFFLKLLHCGGYSHNQSPARALHHFRLAKRFRNIASTLPAPDIIVGSFPTVGFSAAAVAFADKRNTISVVDIRDPWPDVATNLASGARKLAMQFLLMPMAVRAVQVFREADALVAVSQGFLDWALAKAKRTQKPNDRVIYIGRPRMDRSEDQYQPSWLAALPPEKKIISFVGAFGQVYELELVCEAARELANSGDDSLHFVLAGSGDKTDAIEKLTADLPNVSLPGWIASRDAAALLRRSTVGLAPYKQIRGCMPNKVFEYFAAGLPIISSLEGDMEQLLAEYGAGLSYAPGDLAGLLLALRESTASDSINDDMGKAASRVFSDRFVADHIYGSYADYLEYLYDDCLA